MKYYFPDALTIAHSGYRKYSALVTATYHTCNLPGYLRYSGKTWFAGTALDKLLFRLHYPNKTDSSLSRKMALFLVILDLQNFL